LKGVNEMAEQSGFFNSNVVNGEYDRVYLAEHFAKYFASFIGNGVFGGKSNELMVTQSMNSGMRIEVLSGMAWINGFWYENTSNLSLDISVADGVLNRIDVIVVKLGKIERKIWIEVVRGTPATNAVAPAIQRNSDYHELKLAEVYIKAGATSITQANIVDTRLNSEVCGFVTGVVQQFDTTEFGKQLDGYISEYATEYKAFLDELEVTGTRELESVISRLNKLAVEENALAALSLEVSNVEEKTNLANDALNYNKKNLLPYPYNAYYGQLIHNNGVNWSDLGDGRLKANGTAGTENSYYTLYEGEFPKWLNPGKYILTAGLNDTEDCYVLFVKKRKGTLDGYVGRVRSVDNAIIEITEQDIKSYDILISGYVAGNKTVSSVILEPMLRRAGNLDDVWEPFKLSISEMIQEDEIEKGCFYRMNRFTGIKEWINAPNKTGIEYCLTERWNNKPVYQRTFYLSVLPNKAIASLSTGTQWDRIISIDAYALDSDDLTYYPFPVLLQGQSTPVAVINKIESDGSLALTTTIDASYLQAYVTVKYTKS
jgi:hypothetical protein